jgi:hypothetical protein
MSEDFQNVVERRVRVIVELLDDSLWTVEIDSARE